jgi:hypothetical protein
MQRLHDRSGGPYEARRTDAPDIMQWQTTAAPMARDKIE